MGSIDGYVFTTHANKNLMQRYRVSQNKGVRNAKKGCITVKIIIHPYII